ncbi:Bug family tripartite tricarboxylate transporter substrate binding protein [Ramlibacter sp. PS4R-6]|uniref:Bug family tripartite tricarboxylate transporter substrate binding protein n=1 Tax=Ramlibacter sp. PS4R-6 TaxID=3133438 RepID=UPI00309F549E
MLKFKTGLRHAITACLVGLTAVAAQAAFPDKPIRLVVGFPAGGGADFAARQVADALGPVLGTTVVVDNKPGANGTIAAGEVARAPADGYTLLLGVTASHSIAPALQKLPYDAQRDFTPITEVGYTPLVLVVNPNKSQAKNVQDFIRSVNASTEPVPYGSAGNGNITHMTAELFALSTGTTGKLRHIPYKGSNQAVTDLLGGHISAYFDTLPSSLPFIRNGQLRALAVTSRERAGAAADIPTMREAGLKDYEATTWFGVFGPAKLPADVTQKIYEAILKGLGTPEARKGLTSRGVEPVLDTPAHFSKELEADIARWGEVVKKAKITLD